MAKKYLEQDFEEHIEINLLNSGFRRNHLIADLFSRINFGEKLGSGMKSTSFAVALLRSMEMRDICKKENAPYPEIEYTDTHFYIVFKQNREYIRLSSTTQKILEIIKREPQITRRELAELIGISEDGIKYHLNNLKQKGLLKRIGPDKGGYWKIVE